MNLWTFSLLPYTVVSLHITGTWNSGEFVTILAKFGVQKTNELDLKISRGFIYGNVTRSGTYDLPWLTIDLRFTVSDDVLYVCTSFILWQNVPPTCLVITFFRKFDFFRLTINCLNHFFQEIRATNRKIHLPTNSGESVYFADSE